VPHPFAVAHPAHRFEESIDVVFVVEETEGDAHRTRTDIHFLGDSTLCFKELVRVDVRAEAPVAYGDRIFGTEHGGTEKITDTVYVERQDPDTIHEGIRAVDSDALHLGETVPGSREKSLFVLANTFHADA
jgi:hypothetical protein